MKNYFRLLITGIPGTGKTTLAEQLAPVLHAKVLSEKSLIRKKGIGKWNNQTKEYDVSLPALRQLLLHEIRKTKHNLVIEGHLSCEFSLPVDGIILTRTTRKVLEKRLRKRGYVEVKIQENLFCEEMNYVGNALQKHMPRVPTRVLWTHHPKKGQTPLVVKWFTKIRGKSREKEHTHSTHHRPRPPTQRARTHSR